jgi:hypothetical protein
MMRTWRKAYKGSGRKFVRHSSLVTLNYLNREKIRFTLIITNFSYFLIFSIITIVSILFHANV